MGFSLASALTPSGTGAVAVSYNAGFSGGQPLSSSSFNFNSQSGQLSFVASQNQVSVVVNKIEEYRNGVLVGSMMREMNFIVLSNCSNQSPAGPLDSTSKGDIVGNNVIEICNADSVLDFSLTAYDPDSGNVSAVVSGAPNGLTYTITGNNTLNPKIDFNFTISPPLIPGATYSFFITFQDDGCPISSKQQFAYTIKVIQPISLTTSTLPEGCVPGNDGIVNIGATSTSSSSLEYSFNNGPFTGQSSFAGLSAGIYPFRVRDSLGCTAFNNVRVDTAPRMRIDAITKSDITCFGNSDGIIRVLSTPSSPGVSYTVNPGGRISGNGIFEFLPADNYTVIANGQFGCSDTGSIELLSPPDIAFTNIVLTNNRCNKNTGRIDIGSNISIPVTYSISPNQQSNSYGGFGGLSKGFYVITVIDTNGCYKDTLLEINDEPNNFALQLSKQDITCESDGNNGTAEVTATGGVEPYTFHWTSKYGTEGTQSSITNQRSGIKRVRVVDAIGCELDNYVILEPANCCERVFIPNAFSPNGDDKNEVFRLRTPLTMNNVKFFVVNRWGQKVWETNNHLDSWDGNYPDGTPADIGTYFYFLRYQCDSDENTYKLKGDITIIR